MCRDEGLDRRTNYISVRSYKSKTQKRCERPWRRRSPGGRGAWWPPRFARASPLAVAPARIPCALHPKHLFMPAPPSPSFLRRRLGTWLALALGTPWHLACMCVLAVVGLCAFVSASAAIG